MNENETNATTPVVENATETTPVVTSTTTATPVVEKVETEDGGNKNTEQVNYVKYRVDRAKEQAQKDMLKDLGVKNIENVEITERHHHSAPVSYVPKNQDATISLQSNLDFRFINNNSYGIRFEVTCLNGNVNVSAYKV